MKKIILIVILIVIAGDAAALQGDPPLFGGSCDPNAKINIKDPNLPLTVSYVYKIIKERSNEMIRSKMAPYIEVNPETGKEVYRKKYQPEIDAIIRDVNQWERRAKDKVEKYLENDPCPNGMGLVIRAKYVDLIW